MTKCHECGAVQESDSVETMGGIAAVIMFFSLGFLVRNSYLLHEILDPFFQVPTYLFIGPLFVIIMWGSFAFFALTSIIVWSERERKYD